MFAPGQLVLLDTNVVIEAHHTGCWVALARYFAMHTVEKVIEETQTGAQNRDSKVNIDPAPLRQSFARICDVSDIERATFRQQFPRAVLDPGELDLIIYAGTLNAAEVWFLNSPDKATVRHAKDRQWLDRVVSLEEMARHLKLKPLPLRNNYTRQWLTSLKTGLRLGTL